MTPGGAAPIGVGITAGSGGGRSTRGRSIACVLVATVLLGAVLAVGLVALTDPGSATVPPGQFQEEETDTENDTAAPTVGNLTKIDDETVQLVIEDDVGVDESTIDAGDFLTDVGRIVNVTAEENGTDAHVKIELSDALNTDELTVTVPDDASISDDSGTRIHAPGDARRTVGNMDGVAPFVMDSDISAGGNGTIDIRLNFDDPVESLRVDVAGPMPRQLDLSDFSNGSRRNEYVTTVEPGMEGEYEIEVNTVSDSYGNTAYPRRPVTVTIDGSPPETVAFVDFQASSGRNYTFDASQSRDLSPIRNVTWDMGDGTTLRGERVTHRFEPGNYTVTVYVTDVNGNTGTDDVFVVAGGRNGTLGDGLAGNAGATVRVTGGGDSPSAMVEVRGSAAGEAVRIPAVAGESVASTEAFVLRNLSVTPATNTSYRLGVQTDGPAAVAEVEAAADVDALGGLTVVHDVPDSEFEVVTFTVDVDRAAIDEADSEPADGRLYRRGEDGWQSLETAIVARSNDTVRYRASSPGLSRFAVVVGAGDAEPAPDGDAGSTDQAPSTPAEESSNETDDGSDPLFGLAGVLAVFPLGLVETVLTYVGGLVVAVFLVLKALALSMGY